MLSPNTQAILLLTCHFSKATKADAKPLGNKEWNDFALWLRDQGLTPEHLVMGNPEELLNSWSHSKITRERLLQLLNRGSALALSVEKWLRSGIWIITRSDADYPKRFKVHLKGNSPPVLFGCGNRSLLNQGGLAVVGSRKPHDSDLAYSGRLGQLAAEQGYSVISGGAGGVDETAMLGALAADGTVVGVMANDLLRAASSAKFRQHLLNSNLALISPFYPEAGFNAGNAMQRNKYIYCLADAAVAVHSGTSGGTWTGVLENLKNAWVPMWVKPTDDPTAGNAQLVQQGAAYVRETLDTLDLQTLRAIAATEPAIAAADAGNDLFAGPVEQVVADVDDQPLPGPTPEPKPTALHPVDETAAEAQDARAESEAVAITEPEFYEIFLSRLARWCANEALDVDQLLELSGLHKSQLTEWLKRATEEKRVRKLAKPVRYQWSTAQQPSLFEDK